MAVSISVSAAFGTVDKYIKSWNIAPYVFHVQHQRDRLEQGQEFLVVFSTPQPTMPAADVVVTATFTVRPPREEGRAPKVTYSIETQKAQHSADRPIRRTWLNGAIRRKRMIQDGRVVFENSGRLPQPMAFVPGKYKAAEALANAAYDGADENEERLMERAAEHGDAAELALQNALETDAALEEMLVAIFNDGDTDGNGYLDLKEFRALLETSELDLDENELRQLLVLADANGDGKIEYAEFAPLGADIIQTMRLRKLNEAEQRLLEEETELQARDFIHGLGQEQIVEMFLNAFRDFDTDNSGRLERDEIEKCLRSLTLGATKLTSREIKMILSFVDEDESGTLEYNEFAPLMFNYLVDALKMGFLESEMDELSLYLTQHLESYDNNEDGRLSTKTLKAALKDADLISLTPIQYQSVLSSAIVDSEGKVKIAQFVTPAARMIWKLGDPLLEAKRHRVSQMAKVTPLGALTAEEAKRLQEMAVTVFQTFDADGSGTLDRGEFLKCLVDSKLGLSEKQIKHLMYAADENDDGAIDYKEFAELFHNCLMEMSRQEAINRMVQQETIGNVQQSLAYFLDELMIPLRLAFDIASEGQDACATAAVIQILTTKCHEWGVMPEAESVLAAGVAQHPETDMSWTALMELIKKLAGEQLPDDTVAAA